jgi:adenosylhomocysteine nucleosidase
VTPIGILGAMASEIEALVASMQDVEREPHAGYELWAGSLFGRDCVVARCGMGKVAAAATAQHLFDSAGAGLVVVCGLAGGLQAGLRIGDIVVGDRYVQHDIDASPIFPRWQLPGLDVTYLEPPAELLSAGVEAAQRFVQSGLDGIDSKARDLFQIRSPQVVRGLIVTGDQFITDSERPQLTKHFPDAACVEMEGASIAQVAHMNSKPFLVIRVISDSADASAAANFGLFVEHVAPHYTLGIVRELLAGLP